MDGTDALFLGYDSTSSDGNSSDSSSWWDRMLLDEDDETAEDEEFQLKRQHTTRTIAATVAITGAFLQYLHHQECNQRRPIFTRKRMNWHEHVRDILREGQHEFRKDYRMSLASFNKLCNLLRPSIQVNKEMSTRRTGEDPISPEMMLHCLLRYLAGGSIRDIRIVVRISTKSFYRIVYKCVDAILNCKDLHYHFPNTQAALNDVSAGFADITGNGLIQGCVGCMDGMLLRISAPTLKQAKNAKSFFSGHYQDFGMNVQAVCDSQCRFTYASVAAPGGWNDLAVYRQSGIATQIERLPLGKYIIADNAYYICTEHVLTPFSGPEKYEIPKDAYNFFLSQARIRIEMTFGRFTNKWRIFGRPLQCRLHNVGRLFMCASQLHNFCIDERLLEMGDNVTRGGPPTMIPDAPDEELLHPPVPVVEDIAPVTPDTGNSVLRDILVDKVIRKNLRRPLYNLMRNGRAEEEEVDVAEEVEVEE